MSDAMNAEEMIEYVLSKGEGSELDRELFDDPDQMARVERLRASIHLLLDDGSPFDEPSDLARRTVVFVARNRSRPRTFLEQLPTRVPFRWADFAVAASIFVAGVLTLIPAIQRSRERMNQAGCVFNLQQLGNSLSQYASLHPFLPYPPAHRSDTHAGMFAVMLHDAGVLNDLSLLDCPCNGPCPNRMKELASFSQVEHIRQTDPERYRRMLGWDYAYNVGYRHASGHVGPLDADPTLHVPVLADQPDHDNYQTIRAGNSPNHRQWGQNVLFGDGSVGWFRTRRISPNDPDLFLNNAHRSQPGLDVEDSVLMPSKTPFEGCKTSAEGY
jgi:hypothetical protein